MSPCSYSSPACRHDISALATEIRLCIPVHNTHCETKGFINKCMWEVHQWAFDRSDRDHLGQASHDREDDKASEDVLAVVSRSAVRRSQEPKPRQNILKIQGFWARSCNLKKSATAAKER